LDPYQVIVPNLSFIFILFIPVLDFDLVGLSFTLVDLLWRRWWRRVGVEVLITSIGLGGASTSAILAGVYCGGGHVGPL
jgi:hypothetical protein